MSNNEITINALADDSEATTVTPIFDSTSRQTARMVVPLSSALNENAQTKPFTQHFTPQIPNPLLNVNQPFTQHPQQPFVADQIVVSKPKRKAFWRYVAITFLFIFTLCAGAIGGFVLARYEKQNEAKGVALMPFPKLKSTKGLPETIEAYEDPNAFPEVKIEETSDTIEPTEEPMSLEDPESHPEPLPMPDNPPVQQSDEKVNTQQNQPPMEQRRERKVNQPKQPIAENKQPQQKQTLQKSVIRAEQAREQIKRAIEQIGKILN